MTIVAGTSDLSHSPGASSIERHSGDVTTGENHLHCDVAVIGGGIAGLSLALNLPRDLSVVVVTKGLFGESNTRYAQGGLAAAVGLDDTPELHLRDTLTAGAGLVDEAAASVLVEEARDAVAWLIATGTHFDERAHDHHTPQTQTGDLRDDAHSTLATRYDLGREAAHSRRRVLHSGDVTGAEIERALVAAMRARPGAHILENTVALDLIVHDGVCTGVTLARGRQMVHVQARCGVVLANGGAGRLWLRTSNPPGATADGLALAWRARATLADLEFVQFHPTVLVPPDGEGEPFLISEAVRGEGAYLRNAAGERFMPRYHPDAELAPRDVVARAILSEMLAEGASSAFLDLRHLPAQEMRDRFPTIAATCGLYGLDLATDLIPVAPAAHYFMGGVVVDAWARTTVPGLYAVGEVSCTGVHGANRLASNSLLEGLVFGRHAAGMIGGAGEPAKDTSWPRTLPLPGDWADLSAVAMPTSALGAPLADTTRAAIQRIMWERVSLRRHAAGLTTALDELRNLALAAPVDPETANMLFAAQAITTAALARHESRGGHYREDYPERDHTLDGRHTLLRPATRSGIRARAAEMEEVGSRG